MSPIFTFHAEMTNYGHDAQIAISIDLGDSVHQNAVELNEHDPAILTAGKLETLAAWVRKTTA